MRTIVREIPTADPETAARVIVNDIKAHQGWLDEHADNSLLLTRRGKPSLVARFARPTDERTGKVQVGALLGRVDEYVPEIEGFGMQSVQEAVFVRTDRPQKLSRLLGLVREVCAA